jgi:hypothetical protein
VSWTKWLHTDACYSKTCEIESIRNLTSCRQYPCLKWRTGSRDVCTCQLQDAEPFMSLHCSMKYMWLDLFIARFLIFIHVRTAEPRVRWKCVVYETWRTNRNTRCSLKRNFCKKLTHKEGKKLFWVVTVEMICCGKFSFQGKYKVS